MAMDRQNMTTDEYNDACCSYAALMLHDEGIEITTEKLTKAIKSSGNETEAFYPGLYAKALKGADVGALLESVVTAFAAGAPEVCNEVVPVDDVVQEVKKIEVIEDVVMTGLFGDSDDDYGDY